MSFVQRTWLIAGFATNRGSKVVTSRREKDIEDLMEPFIDDRGKICIQSTVVNDDIRAYVHNGLQTDRDLRRWQDKPEIQQEIENTSMDKADYC